MNNIKNVAIYGSCATKFPFTTIYNPDYKERYKCIINDQLHSFISTVQEPEEYDLEEISFTPNLTFNYFITKSIKQDLEKSFIRTIKNYRTDYVIFDVYYDVVRGIVLFDDDKMLSNITNLDKTEFYKRLNNVRKLNVFNNPVIYYTLWKEYCDKFFEVIRNESQDIDFILSEVRVLNLVQKENSSTYTDTSYTRWANILNHFLKKFEDYIKKTQDVYVVKFNEKNVLSENHVAGRNFAHYSDEYYTNYLKEIDKINQFIELKKEICFTSASEDNPDFDSKENRILQLKHENDVLKDKFDESKMKLFKLRNKLNMYCTARIDLISWGSNVGVELVEISDEEYFSYDPTWLDKNKASGKVIETNEETVELKIKCIGEGLLKVYLRTKDVRDKNRERFPIFIDYTELIINDEEIFDENILVNHDHPYIFEKSVVHDEIVSVKVSWKIFSSQSEYIITD